MSFKAFSKPLEEMEPLQEDKNLHNFINFPVVNFKTRLYGLVGKEIFLDHLVVVRRAFQDEVQPVFDKKAKLVDFVLLPGGLAENRVQEA